jgi:hypothetical protein
MLNQAARVQTGVGAFSTIFKHSPEPLYCAIKREKKHLRHDDAVRDFGEMGPPSGLDIACLGKSDLSFEHFGERGFVDFAFYFV